jgi:LAS superfamily LD-carboxypeptidase LdcB
MLTPLELTGRARTHLEPFPELGCALHRKAGVALLAMRETASAQGIDLAVASGHRGIERQVAIWNGKFRGERPLLDRHGAELERVRLTDREAVDAILAWSALPGASRHHWGSDVDLIDRAAVPRDYRIELTTAEFAHGLFAQLSIDVLAEALAASSMDAREQVLARLPELYVRYVVSVDGP